MELDKEVGRNDITKQVIELKLGDDFIVSKKPMTKRKAQSFSPYSRSFQDLCIQHCVNSFQGNVVVAGLIITGETSEATIMDVHTRSPTLEDGTIITGVIELKLETVEVDQTLAEMLCTLTDCGVEELKKGRQLEKAMVYGSID